MYESYFDFVKTGRYFIEIKRLHDIYGGNALGLCSV
jgi:hypothetical protein